MSQIRLAGELSIYQVADLKPLLNKALLEYQHNQILIELNLQDITECDGAGLQLLLALANAAARLETTVILYSVPQVVRELLEQLQISSRFTLQEQQ